MRISTFLSLAFAIFVGAASLTACGDDDDGATVVPLTPSGLGETCSRTGDCGSGLVCVNNFCSAGVGAGGEGTGSPGPALGEEGESCTNAGNCLDTLMCIEQRCVATPGSGGTGSTGPRLGRRGESCEVVSDCGEGLTCIQRATGGICDLVEYGLEPSGKVCGGECAEAADCCELPTVYGIKSCTDLIETYLLGDAATTCPVAGPPTTGYEAYCFYYRSYCQCAANTWACTNNRCAYNAACTVSGTTWGGCPSYTRSNQAAASTTCNPNVGRCALAQPCAQTTDCLGQTVADDVADTCTDGECTCYQNQCFRRCNEDNDCMQRYTCNMDTFVCEPGPGCSSDEECSVRLTDATAECREGTCVIPCVVDQDCSDSGSIGGGTLFNGSVCNAMGVCQVLGCVDDAECSTGGLRLFCVDAPSTVAPVRSAITD